MKAFRQNSPLAYWMCIEVSVPFITVLLAIPVIYLSNILFLKHPTSNILLKALSGGDLIAVAFTLITPIFAKMIETICNIEATEKTKNSIINLKIKSYPFISVILFLILFCLFIIFKCYYSISNLDSAENSDTYRNLRYIAIANISLFFLSCAFLYDCIKLNTHLE